VDTLSNTFKALSDETRVQIMTLLLEHDELCVCDFVGALGQTQSKVSRHLRYLYHAGLVRDRREGLWTHYRMSPDLKPEQATIVAALSEAVGEERKQELRRSLERWFVQKASTGAAGEQGTASSC
jgi:ArsR family transcriptional regulator, arsenate/arsenite/antimonite-responsive transcriptional repressor